MILKVVHQVVLVMTIQPPLFVSGFRRTAVGFRLLSVEMVDAPCLFTIRLCLIISWGLIPRPLWRKYLITMPIPRCLRRGSLFGIAGFLLARQLSISWLFAMFFGFLLMGFSHFDLRLNVHLTQKIYRLGMRTIKLKQV